jgi:hypothetical protein
MYMEDVIICKVCNTYIEYIDGIVYIDNGEACIDCPCCMNQIKLKDN